jgi:hypothetical protein
MATTTPNYGWPVPTSTDYVKDGATAIEALGDAIDATVFGLGSAGFTQVIPTSIVKGASGSASVSAGGAVTFSGTESISLNGCFTSTYDNYRIIFAGNTSTHNEISARYRASGTDDSSSNYFYQVSGREGTGAVSSATADTNRIFVGLGSGKASISMDVFEPQKNVYSTGISMNTYLSPGTNVGLFTIAHQNDVASVYDGMSFYMTTGTFTGIIRVYGYKNG